MFTNLIESRADKSAFKRRTSFFLATVASYSLILFTAAIVGVITYDAQVEAQTTEMQIDYFIPPVDRNVTPERPREPSAVRPPRPANAPVNRNLTESVRTAEATTTTNDPSRVPDNVGAKAANVPPVTGKYRIGNQNADPPSVTPDTSSCVTCSGTAANVVPTEAAPIPPKPKPSVVRAPSSIILSKVIDMPKPSYPVLAKQARIQGPVNVQILIDETGRVVSAQAVKGSPMLTQAAVDAARRARFTPTKLGNDPVKVQGVITYNFILQ